MNESNKCVQKDLAHIWHPASQMKDYEDFPPIIIDHGKAVFYGTFEELKKDHEKEDLERIFLEMTNHE